MIALAALVLGSAAAVRVARAASAASKTRHRAAHFPRRRSLAAVGRRVAEPLRRRQEGRTVERDLPDALDAVARSLRSGSSLRQAIEEASAAVPGPLGADLLRVRRSLQHGDPLPDALERWVRARPLAGVRLTVAALGLGAETGGASAQAVDGLAATLRTNLAIVAEVRALSSQARLSALVIVLAPIAFSLLAFGADASSARFLLTTPLGLVCLLLGMALDLVGWLWMRRITAAVA